MTAAARTNRLLARAPTAPGTGARLGGRWTDIVVFGLLSLVLLWLVVRGASHMDYKWQWARIWPYVVKPLGDGTYMAGPLLRGLRVTLELSAAAFLIAIPIGLATALLLLSGSLVGRLIARAYVEVIRNTPLLLQILIFYFIVAKILGIPRWWCGVLALALYEGAFAAEIIRGAIVAVPRGQWEAAKSIGLRTAAIYRFVVLPQALPLMLPPMTGVTVNLVKHSAIVSVIAIFDLTNEGRTIASDTFMSFEVWLVVAALYLAVTVSLSLLAGWLEKRLAPPSSRA